MNAVVPLRDTGLPQPHDDPAQSASEILASPPRTRTRTRLDEAVIARAIAEASRAGRSATEILKETSGLAPAALAEALAAALDYRFVSGEELATLDPAFDILAPSEATRRSCAVVREIGRAHV